jgi:hypothetical protein
VQQQAGRARLVKLKGWLRLIQLIPEAKRAFYEDKLTVAFAFEVARLQPTDQRRALQECFPHHRNAGAVLKDKHAETGVTVRELRGWIALEIHLDFTSAPFAPQDEKLLPAGDRALAVRSSLAAIRPCFPRFHGEHPFDS